MPKKGPHPLPTQGPLRAFEKKIRAFVRKSKVYRDLLKLGFEDICKKCDGDPLYHETESAIFLESTIDVSVYNMNQHGFVYYCICHSSIEMLNGHYDLGKQHVSNYPPPKKYKKRFYKIANGIIYGLTELEKHYLKILLWNVENVDETKLVINLKPKQLPLYISHKWKEKENALIYQRKLKNCKIIN